MAKLISVLLHVLIVVLLALLPAVTVTRKPRLPLDAAHSIALTLSRPSPKQDQPGSSSPGSGGNTYHRPPSYGRLPRFTPHPLLLPAPPPDHRPLLAIEVTLPGPDDIQLQNVNVSQIGDPNGLRGLFSLGTNGPRGIGTKGGDSYGDSDGPAAGNPGGGFEAPTTDPVVIYKSEPEFSEEARKAKLQGMVVLEAEIGADGRVHQAHVMRGLGLGLDEKAIDAVSRWRFRAAQRRGRAVPVRAVIEINFRLL